MHQKLISYSTSAIAFIFLHDAKAQAVYTDIDPDYVFDQSPEGVWLDIDDNGTSDFGFQNYSFTTYSFSIQETHTFQFLLAIRYDVENALAGDYNADSNCFPFALDNGNLINAGLNWQSCQTQFLAFKRFHSGVFTHTGSYENWYNSIITESVDRYLGIRFIDEKGGNHYGWIRCDVLDEGRTLIIKDYAYETKCDVGILAGDIVGDTSVSVENINPLDANVYIFENAIHVDLNNLQKKTELHIYSISGDLVYTKILSELNTEISLSIPKGIYMVKVISKNGSYSKKVFIN